MTTYIYHADVYCETHIIQALATGDGEDFDGWALGNGVTMSTEDNLNELAAAFGVDRSDEYSFDSDYFPKVNDSSDDCSECPYIYNVYTLWEGTVEIEEGANNLQAALDLFNNQVDDAANAVQSGNDPVSVHLYEVEAGVMHCETFVE